MARRFLVPVELPGNASADLYAVPKQQLDAGLATKAGTGHTHAASDLPVTPRTASASTSYSADGTVAGDIQLTCTGDTVITPTGTPNGRMLIIECLASGAQRAPSVHSSVLLPTSGGPAARSLTVPQNSIGIFGLRYSSLRGGWILSAAQVA